jgi:hypothetical protein
MKYFNHFFCIALLSSVLVAFSPRLSADTSIHGVVVNGSTNQNVAGVDLELRRNSDPGKEGKLIATTVSTAGGKFSFKVPLTEHDSLLVARARFKGFSYEVPAYDGGQRLGQFDVKIDPSKVRLPVFDTTNSLVPLTFAVHHLEVKSKPGGIKCSERIVVNNPTKKTFLGLGTNHATILLDLPDNAKNVTLDSQVTDGKIIKNPGGYSIAKAILPSVNGEDTNIIVNYEMDWPSKLPWKRSLDLTREIQYPTRFFFVQRSDTERGLQVKGFKITEKTKDPLSPDQTVQLNINGEPKGRVINAIGSPKAEDYALVPGDELQIEVSNPVNPTFWAFFGFLLLLIVLIPLSLWRRSVAPSSNNIKADKMGEPVNAQSVNRRTLQPGVTSSQWLEAPAAVGLIEQIAALDEAFAAGELQEGEYRARRDVYKRALLQFAPEKQ